MPDERPMPLAKRGDAGRFGAGDRNLSQLGARGGRASALSRQISACLSLWTPGEDHPYQPYAARARKWMKAKLAELARDIGGGEVGAGVTALVASAARSQAVATWLHDHALQKLRGKPQTEALAQSLSYSRQIRQDLIAAHELAAKEAVGRRAAEAARGEDLSWLDEGDEAAPQVSLVAKKGGNTRRKS